MKLEVDKIGRHFTDARQTQWIHEKEDENLKFDHLMIQIIFGTK
jgi:hypothetical protein